MTVSQRGPNVNIFDATGPIAGDPLFNGPRTPIPASWYDTNKRTYSLVDQDALYASLTFARFFARVGADTLTAISDAAVVSFHKFVRNGSEVVGVVVDVNVSVRHFVRAAVDSLGAPTDTAFLYKNTNTIVNPMVDRWP